VSFGYRIRTFSESTGSPKANMTPARGVFSVDEYSIAPDGNCLEATFRLVPTQIVDVLGNPTTILPRDTMVIETRPNPSTAYTVVYAGYVALAGNPRSDNVETFRCVGHKQRFYEILLARGSAEIPSDDVATMANTVYTKLFQNALFPEISGTGGFSAPLLGFTQGRRFPQLESIGEAFDALAATVGRFVVPTATTYTYDGVTFNAGDVVPPVTWGVRANGQVFFRRALPNVSALAETDDNVDVTWPAISGEEVVDDPLLVYYPGMDTRRITDLRLRNLTTQASRDLEPLFQPMFYRPLTPNPTQRLVQLPEPGPYLLNWFPAWTVNANTFSNPDDAYDGNPATAATGTAASVGGPFIQLVIGGRSVAEPFVVRLDASFGDTSGIQVDIALNASVSGQTQSYVIQFIPESPPEAGALTRLSIDFPVLFQSEVAQLAETGFWNFTYNVTIQAIDGPNGDGGTVSVFDFRPFVPALPGNTEVADQLVQAFRRPIVQEVTDVKVFGNEPIRTQIDLTPEVGSVIEVPVERIQYSITTAEGITTTYHAGQAFDGELVSERVVLEGLARRAVRSNG
jgi:hypothetical protein